MYKLHSRTSAHEAQTANQGSRVESLMESLKVLRRMICLISSWKASWLWELDIDLLLLLLLRRRPSVPGIPLVSSAPPCADPVLVIWCIESYAALPPKPATAAKPARQKITGDDIVTAIMKRRSKCVWIFGDCLSEITSSYLLLHQSQECYICAQILTLDLSKGTWEG